MDDKYSKYLKTKEDIRYSYRGYPLEKILALDLITQIFQNPPFNIKQFVYCIRTINLKKLKFNEPDKTFFSIGDYGRKDYYEIWEYVKSYVQSYLSFDFFPLSLDTKISIKNILRALSVLFKTKKLSLSAKIMLSTRLAFYLNIIDTIEKINPIARKYCSFSSVHPLEAILTIYFQKKAIPTYSLQHGLYFIFKQNIPIDSIAYDNFISDFHFCWGQYTKDEFVKYGISPDSLIVGGYPRKLKSKPIPLQLNKKECLVLLARYTFHSSNLKLIEILKQFSVNYSVNISLKLHPSLNWEDYLAIAKRNAWNIIDQNKTINDLLNDSLFGWSIAVNTAAYYEAYIHKLPCLRFNDGTFDDSVDITKDKFGTIEELLSCLDKVPFDRTNMFDGYYKAVEKNLNYAIGINVNNYQLLNE